MEDILGFKTALDKATFEATICLEKINDAELVHEVMSIINDWQANVTIVPVDHQISEFHIKLTSTPAQCEGFAKALEKYNQTN
jgi:hypothetical protein